jgi:hypothetical protein
VNLTSCSMPCAKQNESILKARPGIDAQLGTLGGRLSLIGAEADTRRSGVFLMNESREVTCQCILPFT